MMWLLHVLVKWAAMSTRKFWKNALHISLTKEIRNWKAFFRSKYVQLLERSQVSSPAWIYYVEDEGIKGNDTADRLADKGSVQRNMDKEEIAITTLDRLYMKDEIELEDKYTKKMTELGEEGGKWAE